MASALPVVGPSSRTWRALPTRRAGFYLRTPHVLRRSGSHGSRAKGYASPATANDTCTTIFGRTFRIYWDLDNIRPAANSQATLVLAHRIKAAVEELGCDVESFSAYANTRTLSTLHLAQPYLEAGGVRVVQVQPTPDAADLQLMTDAYLFAKQQPHDSGVVIVSGDTGNVSLMEHLKSIGVCTICIAPFESYYRKAWKTRVRPLQPLRPHQLKLARSCDVALVWNPHDEVAVSSAEQEYTNTCISSVEPDRLLLATCTAEAGSSFGSSPQGYERLSLGGGLAAAGVASSSSSSSSQEQGYERLSLGGASSVGVSGMQGYGRLSSGGGGGALAAVAEPVQLVADKEVAGIGSLAFVRGSVSGVWFMAGQPEHVPCPALAEEA